MVAINLSDDWVYVAVENNSAIETARIYFIQDVIRSWNDPRGSYEIKTSVGGISQFTKILQHAPFYYDKIRVIVSDVSMWKTLSLMIYYKKRAWASGIMQSDFLLNDYTSEIYAHEREYDTKKNMLLDPFVSWSAMPKDGESFALAFHVTSVSDQFVKA